MRRAAAGDAAPRWSGVLAFVIAVATAGAVVAAADAAPTRLKDNLYGTAFVDQNTGWVVGAFGSIFRTSDGGATWQPQVSQTTQQIYDVDFVDTRHGWVVGASGLILHTADGGETWTAQSSGIDKHLFSVDFVDALSGVAVGDWGAVLTTADGGRTWENHALPDDIILNDVSMVDRRRGWIAAELGIVYMTQDGGRTWTKQATGVEKTLFGVFFADAQRGWVVGIDALILRTEDSGVRWTVLNGSTEIRELEQVGFSSAYENPSLYAVQVVGDLGVAVGEAGAVFLSADGGRTWTRRPSPLEGGPKWFRALSLVAGPHGAVVGAEGKRLRVVDGRIEQPDGGGRAAEALH